MEIPLKSKAKVSMVNILNDKYFLPIDEESEGEYKLTRTYSETEVNNFDEDTGHRLYDDELFRPKKMKSGVTKIYSRSHGLGYGIEDEYIPGLNFSDMVYQWAETPDLSRTNSTTSFLNLDDLHAKVSPKRIGFVPRRVNSGNSDFDSILDSLPSNFNDLPYSQRKKLVKSINDLIDYSQFSSYMKNNSGKKTLANRLLSSTTDLKKLNPVNVDEKGAKVMNYELGKVIGFGAWGTIRECFDDKKQIFAMKIVNSNKKIFKKEIEIWKIMNHPNVLKLIDYLETDSSIFCLMSRANGGTLFDLVLKWGIYEDEDFKRIDLTINYIKQITKGINYLHKLGIVHGDIKLENVLVEKKGDESNWKMILCDFGMSRFYKTRSEIRSKSSMTEIRKPFKGESLHSALLISELGASLENRSERTLIKSKSRSNSPIRKYSRSSSPSRDYLRTSQSVSSIESIKQYLVDLKDKELKRQSQVDLNLPDSHIGSLPYASPELLSPNPPPLGPSADIWAFGVLTFTMIIGKLPFQHFYEPRLRAMIIKGKFPQDELRVILDKFSWLGDLINGCLEKDITKRLDINLIKDYLMIDD